jgi:hypothetical protein
VGQDPSGVTVGLDRFSVAGEAVDANGVCFVTGATVETNGLFCDGRTVKTNGSRVTEKVFCRSDRSFRGRTVRKDGGVKDGCQPIKDDCANLSRLIRRTADR